MYYPEMKPDRASVSPLRTRSVAAPGPAATLAEQAYSEIRRRLVTVELAPGSSFSETEIADALNRGKTPVREALARLRLEGLVQVQARSGYKVVDVTLKDANDVCELRALLEGESARAAAEVAHQAAPYLSSLDRRSDRASEEAPAPVQEWIESDRAFHLELARVSGNARLAEALDRTLVLFGRLSYLSLALDPRTTFPVHDHDDLIAAIADADGARARSLVISEVHNCQARIVEALLSSESVTQANVDVRQPSRFYLDIPTKPGP
jgi:DNA-binding GntR family transcriptional regulator